MGWICFKLRRYNKLSDLMKRYYEIKWMFYIEFKNNYSKIINCFLKIVIKYYQFYCFNYINKRRL